MTAVYVRKAPEADRAALATAEINRIQDLFAINRMLGEWKSSYPQVGYSKTLGCQVREVQPKDIIR